MPDRFMPRFMHALALALGLLASPPAASESLIDPEGWTLVFAEEFDAPLDVTPWGERPSRWIAHTPWNGDFGDAEFTDPGPGFPFTQDDGVLSIEARREADGHWRAGLLSATDPQGRGFSARTGYFEARMRVPPGKGVWPAFWLMGLDRSAMSAEIDVMEHYGHMPERFSSKIHVWGARTGGEDRSRTHRTTVGAPLAEAFHSWGVLLEENHITFYFDRRAVWDVPRPPEFDMPFYPLVNLALGSGWPIDETPDPSYLLVDHVRVYALPE
ncbi:glycoside hydrolase family 16 protein [Oceanicella sp. SM1341]|uniref:glycoside hydrolase family 16 protein n=1 Tax=Oceanicella sp. SM1341 TaxID=1548889 RepID=UPI000E46C42A|nr:glycoside hydrolase family 16 protein [Oceanicella sp. SM1341]